MANKKLNLAVLISGSGSNLQAIIDACADESFPATIKLVLSNNPEAYGLERAKKARILTEVVNHKDYASRGEFEDSLGDALAEHGPIDLICLAGFMRILTPEFTVQWTDRMINTHPSLLPRHGGKGMYGEYVHKAVLAAGDTESGPTIHFVTAECDQGPVILQRRVPVLPGDTADTLAARVLEQEHIAYPEAIRLLAQKPA